MNCKKCGNSLPNNGAICKFCGAMMSEEQIVLQNNQNKNRGLNQNLKSDLYGVEKNIAYNKNEKENKILGVIIIAIILVFIIVLALLLNI